MASSRAAVFRADADADQVEAASIRLGAWVPLGNALSDELISEAILDDAPATGKAYQVVDAEMDTRVGAVSTEVQRRSKALGTNYPFEFDAARQALHHKKSASQAYEFCLSISVTQSFHAKPHASMPRVFERLTGRVVAAFLGDGAVWYRLGWPPEDDRPTRLRDAIAELAAKTKEWPWRSHPDVDADPGPTRVKDGGIDIVAWKYPPDGRVVGFTLVGQCACGNDWTTKASDLNLDRFDLYVPRRTVAKEIRFFSLPFARANIVSVFLILRWDRKSSSLKSPKMNTGKLLAPKKTTKN